MSLSFQIAKKIAVILLCIGASICFILGYFNSGKIPNNLLEKIQKRDKSTKNAENCKAEDQNIVNGRNCQSDLFFDDNVLKAYQSTKFSHFFSDQERSSDLPVKHTYKKLVFILIDGFRYDYFERHKYAMPFLQNLPNKWTFRTKAGLPTVTMPQIKSMMVGNRAQYLDLLLNFGASGIAIQQDNLILKLKKAGKKIHFYGDDTWLKLFPPESKLFDDYDGTHSFYVHDYTEVDNNVTRHIDNNLHKLKNTNDLDVLILHYLGVDHIGHSKFPDTELGIQLLDEKLLEMDKIIEKIYNELDNDDDPDTLFFISGDHGMDPNGIHGGSADSELYTFSALLFPRSENKNFKTPWDIQNNLSSNNINIIDIASTLSVFLGQPVPNKSIGKVLTSNLAHLEASVLRMACLANLSDEELAYDTIQKLKELWLDTIESTLITEREFIPAEELVPSPFGIDENNSQRPENYTAKTLSQEVEKDYFNSLWNYQELLHDILDEQSQVQPNYYFLLGSLQFLIIALLCLILEDNNEKTLWKNKNLILLLSIPTFMFFSSSYVEEEWLLWFFINNCCLIILCFYSRFGSITKTVLNTKGSVWISKFFDHKKTNSLFNRPIIIILILYLFISKWHYTGAIFHENVSIVKYFRNSTIFGKYSGELIFRFLGVFLSSMIVGLIDDLDPEMKNYEVQKRLKGFAKVSINGLLRWIQVYGYRLFFLIFTFGKIYFPDLCDQEFLTYFQKSSECIIVMLIFFNFTSKIIKNWYPKYIDCSHFEHKIFKTWASCQNKTNSHRTTSETESINFDSSSSSTTSEAYFQCNQTKSQIFLEAFLHFAMLAIKNENLMVLYVNLELVRLITPTFESHKNNLRYIWVSGYLDQKNWAFMRLKMPNGQGYLPLCKVFSLEQLQRHFDLIGHRVHSLQNSSLTQEIANEKEQKMKLQEVLNQLDPEFGPSSKSNYTKTTTTQIDSWFIERSIYEIQLQMLLKPQNVRDNCPILDNKNKHFSQHFFKYCQLEKFLFQLLKYSLAHSMYYQLGNSFTPMSFDLSPVYLGVYNFYPAMAGLSYVCTFMGYLVYFYYGELVGPQYLDDGNQNQKEDKKSPDQYHSYKFVKILSMLVYFIVALNFRDHLSVWTVFSPKVFVIILDTLYFLMILRE